MAEEDVEGEAKQPRIHMAPVVGEYERQGYTLELPPDGEGQHTALFPKCRTPPRARGRPCARARARQGLRFPCCSRASYLMEIDLKSIRLGARYEF